MIYIDCDGQYVKSKYTLASRSLTHLSRSLNDRWGIKDDRATTLHLPIYHKSKHPHFENHHSIINEAFIVKQNNEQGYMTCLDRTRIIITFFRTIELRRLLHFSDYEVSKWELVSTFSIQWIIIDQSLAN